jgi:hypothetical protein
MARGLGGSVALFVLIVVGLVVGQTWLDWRDSTKGWIVPDWAKGIALGGVIAVSLAATASFASVWLRDAAAAWTGGVVSFRFWMELGFLVAMMGIIVLASRRKHGRVVLLVICLIAGALWLGMVL